MAAVRHFGLQFITPAMVPQYTGHRYEKNYQIWCLYVKWFQRYGVLNEIQDGRRPPSWIRLIFQRWCRNVLNTDLSICANSGLCILNGSKVKEC
jgi:hypothetical protein